MNLNEKPGKIISSNEVTLNAMQALRELVIDPMQDKLSDEELEFVEVLGEVFMITAHKATLYEEMIENGHGSNYGYSQNFSRN